MPRDQAVDDLAWQSVRLPQPVVLRLAKLASAPQPRHLVATLAAGIQVRRVDFDTWLESWTERRS